MAYLGGQRGRALALGATSRECKIVANVKNIGSTIWHTQKYKFLIGLIKTHRSNNISMIRQFELYLCITTSVKCEILFYFSLSHVTAQVFKRSTFWQKIYKQKNKKAAFCFLPRVLQNLVTPL